MARQYKKTLQFTQEQAQEIKSGNLEARNKFYNDNYEVLKMMAFKWCYQFKSCAGNVFTVEDLLNQIYLDLPYYRFDTFGILVSSIRKSFKYSIYGGVSGLYNDHLTHYMNSEYAFDFGYIQVDGKAATADNGGNSDASYLLDIVACSPSPAEELERRDSDNDLILIRGILAEYLPAVDCDLYILCLDGYTVAEACRKLGIKIKPKAPIEKKLRVHAHEIVEKLIASGFESCAAFLGQSGYTPPARVYKTSEKKRETNRRYYERLKAQKPAKVYKTSEKRRDINRRYYERLKARKLAEQLQGNAA